MAKIVVQDDARVAIQSMGKGKEALRSRVPTGILIEAGAEDGSYIRWTLYDDGRIVGTIIDASEARPRSIAQIAAAPKVASKKSAKKAASKAPAKRPTKRAVGGLDDAFGGGEDEDDGSTPPTVLRRRPIPINAVVGAKAAGKRSIPPAANRRRPTPTPPVSTRGARQPIPKPGARKRGAVRYDE